MRYIKLNLLVVAITFSLLARYQYSFENYFEKFSEIMYGEGRDEIKTLPVRFAVIGDYGLNGQAEADVAALVKNWDPDIIATVGDNNYYLGESETIDENIGQYYHEFIHPYMGTYGLGATENRFFPALGNHDWYTENAQPYLDYFSLPGNERYYDFVKGPVHFFILDSDAREPDGISSTSIQALWLQSRLSSSISAWQVVILHHAPFSSGAHGSNEILQWPYKSWGADVVISGHDHIYERLIIDDFPYFVNGLGGGPLANFGELVEGSVLRYNADYGALFVSATKTSMTFQFMSRAGQVIDSYVMGTSPTVLVNSTLPTSRTVLSGTTATIFSTVLNAGTETAHEVQIMAEPMPPGLFAYYQTDCETNLVVGEQNPVLDLPSGGKLCYLLSFIPDEPFYVTDVHIQAYAANSPVSTLLSGINTWRIRSTSIAGPDIVALTTTTDFHQTSCLGSNVFAVALSNVGVAANGNIFVTANTGSVSLPLVVSIFETDPNTSKIIGDNILENIAVNDIRTIGVFVTFNNCIQFDPARHRIFIEFRDTDNNLVGSTSTAVSTNR